MPLIDYARTLEILSSRIQDVDIALEKDGTYEDARDELESALSHIRTAWLILRAPDEDDPQDSPAAAPGDRGEA